jgi:hypothetical protein
MFVGISFTICKCMVQVIKNIIMYAYLISYQKDKAINLTVP